MKWLKGHWRGLFRALAALLLAVGLFSGYWWFYKLAPFRRTSDANWRAAHSEKEYWRETQSSIRRGIWSHDDGFTVGLYGDKSWAKWIMAHVTPGGDMGCISDGPCHSATSMRYITNQDVGDQADAWLDWWKKNKSKSQEEWIAEGFHQLEIEVDVPPSPEQASILLALLDSRQTSTSNELPNHVKYNAFRCLRDSGFEPVRFAISNQEISDSLKRGLLEYAERQRQWPRACDVGILPFGEREVDAGFVPMIFEPKFQLIACALVFGPPLAAAGLLFWSLKW